MKYFWLLFWGGLQFWLVFSAGQMATKGYTDAALIPLFASVFAQYKFYKVTQ